MDVYDQADLQLDDNLLVIVDQFEELFRYRQLDGLSEDKGRSDEAIAFVNLLLEASKQDDFPIYVVITMRSDFLGDCAQFYGLAEAINIGQYLVPRLTRAERREAIRGPIEMMGAQISPVLLTRLVNDVGDNPDQLSILQHALNRTWTCWQDKTSGQGLIELTHYEAIGTMAHALDQHADKAFKELNSGRQQIICEKVFKAITDKATDPRGVRRPTELQTLCRLTNASQAELAEVLSVFRKRSRSFLMPPEGETLESNSMIDISHESLMRVWETLNRWADEESQSARFYMHLTEKWRLYCNKQAQLLRDLELSSAVEWQRKNKPSQVWADQYNFDFDNVTQFITASIEQEEKEKVKAEQARIDQEKAKIHEAELTQKNLARERELKQQRKYNFRLVVGIVVAAITSSLAAIGFYSSANQSFNHQLIKDLLDISRKRITDEEKLTQSLVVASRVKRNIFNKAYPATKKSNISKLV